MAGFEELVDIMARLRGPDGCPWDNEQTHDTLKRHLIEESYEVVEAIDQGDDAHLQEELGDLLLQIVFNAEIAAARGAFDIDDVVNGLNEKLTRRHPHIFDGPTTGQPAPQVKTSEDVMRNWEIIKKDEEGKYNDSRLSGVPRALPALLRAYKVQRKMADVGFDWQDESSLMAAFDAETEELKRAANGDGDLSEEIGDMLFMLTNIARFKGIEPEGALRTAINKIEKRFRFMERAADAAGRRLDQMTLDEQEGLWQKAKIEE